MAGKQSSWMLRAFAVWCILSVITISTGCNDNEKRTTQEDHYANDGYMGFTNAHPDILTSPNSLTYSSDVEMMKKALADVPGIRKSIIVINGGNAIIRILVDQRLSGTDIRRIRDEAQRVVSFMVPRYDVRITAYQY